MNRTLELDEAHYNAAAATARARGTSTEQYVQSLIDADGRSFDEILAPMRSGFDAMSDAEADDLLERARKAARGRQ